jgi:hypothetical protein
MDNIKMNKISEEIVHEEEYHVTIASEDGKCKLKSQLLCHFVRVLFSETE